MVTVFPYIAVGLLAFALYACRREAAERIVVAVMSLWLVYEEAVVRRSCVQPQYVSDDRKFFESWTLWRIHSCLFGCSIMFCMETEDFGEVV